MRYVCGEQWRQSLVWCLAALLPTGLVAQEPEAQPATDQTAAPEPAADLTTDPAYASIRAEDIQKHVEYLASDKMQGRASGSKENEKAGRYIAKHFAKLGLKKVADKGRSWLQPFETDGRRYKKVETFNVLGLLPGTDPKLSHETLVIGGHFDHVGLGRFGSRGGDSSEDKIFNGADDNASGTAAVLELSEAFAKNPLPRSVLFIAFSAEELGLLGSKHYCENPAIPLEDTIAMLNFDMVGRSEDDYLFLGGVGTSPVWPELVDRHAEQEAKLALERGMGGRAPTDSTSFYLKEIPVLFFHTDLHVDYHRASDHPGFLNYRTCESIVRAGYRIAQAVGSAELAPEFTANDALDEPKRTKEMNRLPERAKALARMVRDAARSRIDKKSFGRLGIVPASGRAGELMVGDTEPKSSARDAGLGPGDVLLEANGKPLRTPPELAAVLRSVKRGETVELTIRRDGLAVKVPVVVD